MQLQHIALDKLKISTANMRHGRKDPDVSDILPSVRTRGILQPLLVRPEGEEFEVVAGRRRYFCAKLLAEEQGEAEPLPCAVMEPGDDAGALEASLIENIARLDPDEMSQYECFARLIKEGRNVAEIAATFGITERAVTQRLALGNLLPKIREAYRRDEIDGETVRHLTMASKAQQKEWLTLFSDPEGSAPHGYELKQWLFGGQSISTKVALFPLEDYPGEIVADLFGEEGYFADPTLFWQKQNEAIAAKRDALLAAGWREVVVLEPGQHFHAWEHEKTAKRRGGKVFITVSGRGEVEVHDAWLSRKEAQRRKREASGEEAEGSERSKPSRPAMRKSMENYLELHRHAVVRQALLKSPGTAWRLLIAHAIAASGHWQVKPDPQQARSREIAESVAGGVAQQAFAAERQAILGLLEQQEDASVVSSNDDPYRTAVVFARLLVLGDDEVLRIAAFVMAETLAAGSALVEALGTHLKADARDLWQPDDTFFDLVRERATVNALLAEVAGKPVADANLSERTKVQKQIIRDCLAGTNGREKVEGWLPSVMAFPFRAYADGACSITEASNCIVGLFPAS
ncbi:MAG: ParB/RepB/Spo0J family partition protein [Rhodospirillales bacterium]|nr:ParB/RepB/Spo0J family partition protein [Rhodospirillales bacterium]